MSSRCYSGKEILIGCRRVGYRFNKGIDKNYEEKIGMARLLGEKLGHFDWILMVGVTGSVAAGYPKRESDIDLMIVCKENRLWLSRLLVKTWLTIEGIPYRRRGEKEGINEFCFNIWTDERALVMPKEKQTERSAIDLVMMVPVFDRGGCYDRWVRANKWAERWVATGYEQILATKSREKPTDGRRNWLWDLFNWVSFYAQYCYMKPGMGREIVGVHEAYFHP